MRKVRGAGAPYGGRRPSRLEPKTLRSRIHLIVRLGEWKRREGRFGERDFESVVDGGSAPETGTPREQGSRPGLNLRGREGIRLAKWEKAVEARMSGRGGLRSNRKSGREKGNLFSIILQEESFEGASPRVLGAEIGFRGFEGPRSSRG